MTIDEAVNQAAVWPIYGVALCAHLLVFIYGFGSRWWTSLLGVSIFAKWLSFALVFDFLIARRVFGEFPGYGFWAMGIYSFMFLAFSAVVVELIIERRTPAPEQRKETPVRDLTEGGKHIAITTNTVPEIWYKGQRVARTIFTTVLTLLPLVPQVVAIIQGEWAAEWLTGVAVQAVAINAVLTGIIALPPINALLTKIGLGSVPRSAVRKGIAAR